MPTERFFNLPKEKGGRIISAALQEFSHTPAKEISINRIIQEAGISRGSFYQYFKDLQDLQDYLFAELRRELKEEAETYIKVKDGDLFRFFRDALPEIVRIAMRRECKELCRNMLSQMSYADCGSEREFLQADEYRVFLEFMKKVEDRYAGRYTKEDLQIAWEMLFQTLKESAVRLFLFEEETERIFKKYNQKISLIEEGMKAKEIRHVEV